MQTIKCNDGDGRARIIEIGEILAAGLVRLPAFKSSEISTHSGESSLPILGHQSSHADSLEIGEAHE